MPNSIRLHFLQMRFSINPTQIQFVVIPILTLGMTGASTASAKVRAIRLCCDGRGTVGWMEQRTRSMRDKVENVLREVAGNGNGNGNSSLSRLRVDGIRLRTLGETRPLASCSAGEVYRSAADGPGHVWTNHYDVMLKF
jgi:hypothetical protein